MKTKRGQFNNDYGTTIVSDGSPMNQHSAAIIKSLLNESIAGGEMLNDVVVIDIVYLNNVMLVRREQALVKGKA